jgi:hypothetical protein
MKRDEKHNVVVDTVKKAHNPGTATFEPMTNADDEPVLIVEFSQRSFSENPLTGFAMLPYTEADQLFTDKRVFSYEDKHEQGFRHTKHNLSIEPTEHGLVEVRISEERLYPQRRTSSIILKFSKEELVEARDTTLAEEIAFSPEATS